MRHRIFIAVNLPESVKNELADHQKKLDGLFESPSPVRWTRKDNLHVTSVFLGYLTDQEVLEACKIVQGVAQKHKVFSLNLNKILYGPPKKPPRMVWAEGEKSAELGELQKDLENSLLTSSIRGVEKEARPYVPHITLGRIKTWEFRRIEPEERPDVSREIAVNFEVSSIEIMESQLKRAGPDYTVLESCPLQN